jgi:hypothetical protein
MPGFFGGRTIMKRTIDEVAAGAGDAAGGAGGVVPGAARRPLRELMDDWLLDALLERSRDQAGGLRLTGEGSMLGELVRAVLERALQRLAVWCLVPPYALAFALRGTRRTFSRHLSVDDLPTHLEIQARQAAPELTEVILDHRDTCLVDCLASVHQARQAETIDVAVVYRAGHMPAVTHELLRRFGYRPRTAEWLTVFDF